MFQFALHVSTNVYIHSLAASSSSVVLGKLQFPENGIEFIHNQKMTRQILNSRQPDGSDRFPRNSHNVWISKITQNTFSKYSPKHTFRLRLTICGKTTNIGYHMYVSFMHLSLAKSVFLSVITDRSQNTRSFSSANSSQKNMYDFHFYHLKFFFVVFCGVNF